MSGSEGPLSWTTFQPIGGRSPILAGSTISRCLASYRITPPAAGIGIGMLDGSSVYQAEPLPVLASRSRLPCQVGLSLAPATEDDSRAVLRFQGLARFGAQPVTLWDVHEDLFVIPAEARLSWPLSRALAAGPPNAPAATIYRSDGTSTALAVTTGAPGSGEILFDGAMGVTADLSADAGECLAVRYYPLRYALAVEISHTYSNENEILYDLSFSEFLP